MLLGRLASVLSLLLVWFCAAGCSGIKDHVAQERYLAQKLYDYTYSQPPEVVWAEAMRVMGLPLEAGETEGEGRVYHRDAGPPDENGRRFSGLRVVVRERPTGTWLAIFAVPYDGPPVDERDLHTRQTRTELSVMRALAPKDADAFERGALVAGRRARDR